MEDKKIWEILGIEATRDSRQITQAYRDRLSLTNPEDKPEEFKQLRQAYEEALALAGQPKTGSEDDEEILKWVKDLEEIYDDFSRRREVENWEELFLEPVAQTVPGHMRICDELLHFLMEHYFIGHDVWLCMDRHFSLLERKEELCEKYPRNFIEQIIVNGIIYQDILPMKLFIPREDGEECQRYLDRYLAVTMDESGRDAVIELQNSREAHPYGDALILSWKIRFEDPGCIAELEKLADRYQDDLHIALMLGKEYQLAKDYEKAEALYEKQKQYHDEDIRLHEFHADILEAQEEYDEAMKEINAMMGMAQGENGLLVELNERRQKISPFIIEAKLKALENDPDDDMAKIDLFWAYLENEQKDEAIGLFDTIDKDRIPAFDYYNMMATTAYFNQDYSHGVKALEKLIEAIDELPEDSEKNISRKKRKGEMYSRMAFFYQNLKDDDAVMKAYDKALEHAKDKAEILVSITQSCFMKEDYEKARDYARTLIAEKPDSVYGHNLLAYAHYYLHEDQEAYNMISRAIQMDGRDLGFYILKLRILIRNNAFEEAQEILDYLDSCSLENEASVLYAKGLLAEQKEEDREKVKDLYERSLHNMEGVENNYEFTDDLYYRILCIEGQTLDGNVEEDRKKMMELCEKGLSYRPTNKDLLEYKGWLLMKDRRYDESLKIYLDLAKDRDHSAYIDSQLGYLYYQDLEHKAKESRDCYARALERGYDAGAHFYIGMCEMFMGHVDEAEHHFLALKEKEADSIDPYLRLSTVYEMKDDLEKALENIDKVLELVKDRQDDVSRYYLRKVQILRRMKDPDGAIAVLNDISARYQYPARKMIFDILLQFGRYEEAEKMLWNWKWDGEYHDALATLSILKGDFRKARQIMKNHGNAIDSHRQNVLGHLLAVEEEDYDKEEQYLKRWLEPREGELYGDLSQIYGHLAYCAFHRHDEEKKTEYAQMALDELEKRLEEYSLDRTLYLTRKVRLLAMLGRRKEAEELSGKIRKMPLCSHCQYCSCKDLDAFTMDMYDIFNDEDTAYRLAEEGNKKWPDEEDFAVTLSRLGRRREC
ncbi:MAG: hypothetical protein IKX97_07400 [Erysipelotrichaceae bacterium]|nr:hypothetical protein [Erysipelotrichaceae bacterium]